MSGSIPNLTATDDGSPSSSLVNRRAIAAANKGCDRVTAQGCPEGRWDVLDLESGDRFPESCKRLNCSFCGSIQAKARAQLAAASRPERLVTFTKVPIDFQERRQWLQNVVHHIRREGFTWEWFHATEPNPKGTGYHVHGLQHGDYIPQAKLQQITKTIPDIRAIKVEVTTGKTARYVIKGAGGSTSRYVVKGAAGEMAAHLELNGGRPAHWSRGYMRTDDDDPITARNLRLLMQRARPGEWVRIAKTTTADEARSFLAVHQRWVGR